MKTIALRNGGETVVDDSDYAALAQFSWSRFVNRNTSYATRWSGGKDGRVVYMHREIMGAEAGQQVDHANHGGLDNRRGNLRICTQSENTANMSRARGATEYRGVCKRDRGGYRAVVWVKGRRIYGEGTFDTAEEAARRRDALAREYYGAFAILNFPISGEDA